MEVDEPVEAVDGLRREELVRLITQCLGDLGYSKAAEVLQAESGICLLKEPMGRFRMGILEGQWDVVESVARDLPFTSEANRQAVQFHIARQKYLVSSPGPHALTRAQGAHACSSRAAWAAPIPPPPASQECLEQRESATALACLRTELAPLVEAWHKRCAQPSLGSARPAAARSAAAPGESVQELSSWLMCKSADELRAAASWSGAAGGSRASLLSRVQAFVPPTLLLPERRLQTLLDQAVNWQTSQCAGLPDLDLPDPTACSTRRAGAPLSLLEDYSFDREELPRRTLCVLDGHADEVWLVCFSHAGKLLASASKDNMVLVWEVEPPTFRKSRALTGHTDSLCALAWSPNDEHLLTCSNDQSLKLWEVESGACVRTFSQHTESVASCAWLPSGRHAVSAGMEKVVLLWDASGAVLQTWNGPRLRDVHVTADGSRLVAISSEREALFTPIRYAADGTPSIEVADGGAVTESEPITSLSLSRDSSLLLLNLASEEIHVWDVQSALLLHRYRGHRQGRFVVRSTLGGDGDTFVVSGSEDSQVYVWHRQSGRLLEVLPGHSGTVNAVTWHPSKCMFATASDDHSIRVWAPNAWSAPELS